MEVEFVHLPDLQQRLRGSHDQHGDGGPAVTARPGDGGTSLGGALGGVVDTACGVGWPMSGVERMCTKIGCRHVVALPLVGVLEGATAGDDGLGRQTLLEDVAAGPGSMRRRAS